MMICKGDKKVVRKAFGLIEMLAVVAIIAILGSLAIGGYVAAMGSAKEARTKTAMKAVSTAFETIKAKKGFYPQVVPTTESSSDQEKGMLNNVCWIAIEEDGKPQSLVATLAFKPEIKTASSASKPVPELKDYVNKALAEEFVKVVDLTDFVKKYCDYVTEDGYRRYYLKDGWGNPIYYNSPGKFNTMSFDLISTGVSGMIGDPKPKTGTAKKYFEVKDDEVKETSGLTTADRDKLGTVDDIINK